MQHKPLHHQKEIRRKIHVKRMNRIALQTTQHDDAKSQELEEHELVEYMTLTPTLKLGAKRTRSSLPDQTHHQRIIRKQIFEPNVKTGFYRRRRTLTDDKPVNVSKKPAFATSFKAIDKIQSPPSSLRISLPSSPNKVARYREQNDHDRNQWSLNSKAAKTDDNQKEKNKPWQFHLMRCPPCSLFCLIMSVFVLVLVLSGLAALLAHFLIHNETKVTTASKKLVTTTKTTTTSSTSVSTTTVACATGYVRALSGLCVNTQIDFNNCGSIGYVCSSNYSSCSAGVCSSAPSVQLANGISVFAPGNVDDSIATIALPLSISLYNYSTSSVTVSSNGVICLGGCSTAYANTVLPASSFSGPTAFGYWDDLYITNSTSQNIYYAVSGAMPNRTTTFEIFATHYAQVNQYYHFQIIFYENLPNVVKYLYFEASDTGSSATIGVQKSSSGPSMTYSVDQTNSVTPNMTLIFDTNSGTYTG
ncbi:unnamed protein product [Rotaria magnacalcarata]|uniref:Uncharacterized protein n=2 Tax=Rotaria magnacalcarata TaxID=392030 RepID=A0A8S2JIG2_9BILA|nr:unnamed protein product [Rotaria magnacalcarata]